MALVGSISGSLVAITGSISPGADNTYNLGSSSSKWLNVVATNITGSITRLANGTEYLRPGSNVTLTTGSDGSITIASTAAGGGGSGPTVFSEASSTAAYTTSSIAIGQSTAASTKGSDVFFFVSGSGNIEGLAGNKLALFGASVVSSGSFYTKDSATGAITAQLKNDGTISGSALQTVGNLTVQGNATVSGSVYLGDSTSDTTTVAGSLTVGGTTITATAPTTINLGNTAATVNVGQSGTGNTLKVQGALIVSGTTGLDGNVTLSANSQAVTHTGTGNLTISSAGGNVVVESTTFNGNDVTITGDLAVNGGDITTSASTFNLVNTTATTVNIAGAATTVNLGSPTGNVIIPGDLTVQGTTITLSASNLVVEDPLVGFGFLTSSAAATAGDRGFIGGLATEQNVAMFWDESADGFAVSRTTSTPNDTTVTVTDYSTFRSGKLELNGSSVFFSSSDGSSAVANVAASSALTFQQNGVNKIQFADINVGEARVMGLSSGTTLGRLHVSGTSVTLGHSSAGGEGIRISNNEVETGRITSAGSLGAETLSIRAASGGNTPGALTITGSQVTIGGNTDGTVLVTRQGTTHLTINADGSNNSTLQAAADLSVKSIGDDIKFLGNSINPFLTFTNFSDAATVAGFTNKNVTLGSIGTGELILSGAGQIQLNAPANGFLLNRDNSPIGKIDGVASTALNIYARGAANSSLALTLSGSNVDLGANTATGVRFYTAGTHGATVSAVGTTVGLAAGASMTTANVFNSIVTTVNLAGNASTVLNMGNSSGQTWISGSVSVPGSFTTLGNTTLGDASSDRLNIVAAVTSSIIPSDDSAFTLGTADKRWQHIYTGDLHLRNERGDYTLIEENDFLSIRFNKNGKRYKFLLERVPELDEPAR